MQKSFKRTLSLILAVLMVTALFTVAPLSVGAAETDGETVGTEPTIVPGQTVDAEITTGGEMAYIKFVPTKDMKIIVYSSGDSDTRGYFYDSEKYQLEYDDDNGEDYNFKFSFTVTANTTYYIGAKFYDGEKTGTIPVTLIEDKPKTVRFYDGEKLLGSISYDEDTFSYSYSTLYDSAYPELFLADTDERIFKGYQKSSGDICYTKSSDSLYYQGYISIDDFDTDGYLNLYSSWEEVYTINFYNGEARIGSAKVESSQIADYFSVDDSFVLENANGKVFKGYKKDGADTPCITLSSYGSLYCASGTLSTEDFDENKTLNVYAVWEAGYTLSFYNGETFLCDYIVESPDSIGWSIDCNSYSPASTDSAFLSDGNGKVFKGYKKNGSDTLCFSIFRSMFGTRLDYTSDSITAADFGANRTLRLDAEWVEGYTVEFYNGETKVGEHVFESIETIGDIYKTSENENLFISNGRSFVFTGYEKNSTSCFVLNEGYSPSLAYQSGTITAEDFTDRTMCVTAAFNTNVCIFTAYSLSIKGDTSLIFKVDTSQTDESYIYPNVSVTYGDRDHGDWDYWYGDVGDNTMEIRVELAAKLMSADVTITMPDKSCCTYSIRQYAENILSGEYDDYLSQTYNYSVKKITALKSLLKSMLNFGAKAQVQFGCATDDLANKNLAQYNDGKEYTAPVINPANLTSLSYTDSQFDNVGLVYAGSSLGLFEKFGYCVVFEDTKGPCLDNSEGEGREFGEAQQSFPSFSLPDKFKDTWEGLESAQYLTADGSMNIYYVMDPNAANYGNFYLYFKTKAIYPQNFDKNVEINISRTAKNDATYTNSITINPVTYIKRALETTDTTTAAGRTLVDTVTAVYDYCTNAKAFFEL